MHKVPIRPLQAGRKHLLDSLHMVLLCDECANIALRQIIVASRRRFSLLGLLLDSAVSATQKRSTGAFLHDVFP